MKNSKTAKILMLIISAALLVGSVFCIGISAEDTNTTGEIAAQSVIYGEKTYIEFAVYASSASDVSVTYTWEGDETVYTASEYTGDSYSEDTVIFVTDGVALYELGKQVTVTVKVGEDVVDTKTYSVAEFLYKKLYIEGVEGDQMNFYKSLLECGANAQTYLGKDTDALVTKLTYVYTENALVTVNGGSSALVSGSVELDYIGTDKVAAWVALNVDDEEIEKITTNADPYTVEILAEYSLAEYRIVKIDVVETHDCYDETNDHKCDRCDAKFSECADGDNDHDCDICGEVLTDCVDEDKNHKCDVCNAEKCTDSDGDYYCDGCKQMTFENIDKMECIEGKLDIYHSQSATNKPTATSDNVHYTTISTDSVGSAHSYGVHYSLKADPINAANQVLHVHCKAVSSGGANIPSKMLLTPTVVDEGGALLVLQADIYVDSCTGGKNAIHLSAITSTYENVPGTAPSTGYQRASIAYSSSALKIAGVQTEVSLLKQWIRYIYILDTVDNKYWVYYSIDGGTTFTAAVTEKNPTNTTRLSNFADVTHMGIENDTYITSSQSYVDNLSCVRISSINVPVADSTVTID